MRYTIIYRVVGRGRYAVEAGSHEAALALFRAAGDQRHVFAAHSAGHPAVEVVAVHNEELKLITYPDGRMEAK